MRLTLLGIVSKPRQVQWHIAKGRGDETLCGLVLDKPKRRYVRPENWLKNICTACRREMLETKGEGQG
jgi:hypothetical protein